MTGGTDMSDLSDAILNQVILELKKGLDGPAKDRFTKLPPSHQHELFSNNMESLGGNVLNQ